MMEAYIKFLYERQSCVDPCQSRRCVKCLRVGKMNLSLMNIHNLRADKYFLYMKLAIVISWYIFLCHFDIS